MNTTDSRPSAGLRRPRLDREAAMRLAETEYARFLALLQDLSEEEWSRPTDCPGWDVRAVAGHTVGMAQMATGLRETVRQMRAALRRGGVPLDALTAVQVEEHAGLSREELMAKLGEVGPRAARGRRRTPAIVRRMPLLPKTDVGAGPESWSVGFLLDVVLTRDPWMHRMDICRAVGRAPVLTAEHDGVLVADVVEEWAERHGRPYHLELEGPAGGSFARGTGGPELRLDAIDFCRLLSGRPADVAEGDPLLDVPVPF